jgi:hypothetical protein
MELRIGLVCVLALACGTGCPEAPRPAEICDNDLDDDHDGARDCGDPDCFAAPACVLPGELCDNDLDDDGDTALDCDDPDCIAEPACAAPPEELCDNDLDDDGDTALDCDDPDCVAEPACAAPPAELCDNDLDDDGDTAVDCEDPGCVAEPTCAPPPRELCDNDLDDDGDTAVDCSDPGCSGVDPCIQLGAPGDIVIVEIMAALLAVADAAGEWIELRNTTDADIDLGGWILHDIDAVAPEWHVIDGDGPVVVPAGGLLVLGALADAARNGGVAVDHAWAGFSLADDADEIVLEVRGEQIDTVVYATPAWSLAEGTSLALDPGSESADANDAPGAWCAGVAAYNAVDHGTPGTDNPTCP